MSLATMTMTPASAGGPADFEDRNEVIARLVNDSGWGSSRVARLFEISDRHVRRIAREARAELGGDAARPADPTPALTPKEIETMARDYASDPYSSLEDREAALGWVAVVAQASGVAELGRIRFREGIRVSARPRVGQA